MSRWILLVLGLLAALAVALSAATLRYITQTPEGLQFIVARLPHRLGRVTLEVEGVTGTLAYGVQIKRLEIDHERSHLRVNDITGRIDLAPLLWQTLTVPEVTARSMLIQVKPRGRPPLPGLIHFLPRWMTIRAERVLCDAVTIISPSGYRFDATAMRSAGVVRQSAIRVFDTAMTYGALHTVAHGEVLSADPLRIIGTAQVTMHFDGQPDWAMNLSGDGDLNMLPVKGTIDTPMRAAFTGKAFDLAGPWRWESEADVLDFNLQSWGGGNALGRITGHVSAQGNATGFGGHGPLTSAGLAVGIFDADFHGSYANHVLTADRIELTHRESRAHSSSVGTITIADGGPILDLHGTWRDFRWPLIGRDIGVRSGTGNYHLSGTWPYALEADGQLIAADLPAMPVQLMGTLDHDHLNIAHALLGTFNGSTELNGVVRWSPGYSWAVTGTATSVDPGVLRQDLPGNLNFVFKANGNGFDTRQDFAAEIRDLGGTLRHAAARGSGNFTRRKGDWQFERVRATFGHSAVALDGELGSKVDLRFSVDSDDLSVLETSAKGKLLARGVVSGTLDAPRVELAATGTGMSYAGMALKSLDANVDFDAARSGGSSAHATLVNFSYGPRTLTRFELALDGSAASHTIRMLVDATNLHAEMHASAGLAKGQWQGELERVEVKGTEALNLHLEKPTMMFASKDSAHINDFCLQGLPARLCTGVRWSTEQWSATLSANDLPMSTLTSGLSPGVDYKGTLNVTAEAHGVADAPLAGQIRAELANAQLVHRQANGRLDVATLGSGYFLAVARPDALVAELNLDAGEIGTIEGKLNAQRTTASWLTAPIQGQLALHTAELGFVPLYVPEIDRAAGSLAADLTLSGTIGMPLMNGTIKLTNAELNLYQVNFAMRNASIAAELADNALDFDGQTGIGAGHATTRGHLEWRDSEPHGRFELNGENLRVVDIPEAQIDASPDLIFDIDGRKISVIGSVKVPFAKIVPADLTGAVSTSSDEVIVGANAPAGKSFDVTSDITLELGDKVAIDTSGLTGRLTGSIDVKTGGDDVTRGTGELQIEEGKYAAYGRKLDIQHGRLMFTGGPIGDPGVDIRAVKEFPENVAGVNVRGTLLQPRMTFFSEPSLPQSQIVSLILAGGSFATQQDNPSTRPGEQRAGNELLAQGGAILAQQLGARLGLSSKLGIEDMTIESDLNNDTALVLGRYLSPRFYVSYGISLTEALNTLKLRYSLNDHWTVRTEVSEEHRAELVYTIEK